MAAYAVLDKHLHTVKLGQAMAFASSEEVRVRARALGEKMREQNGLTATVALLEKIACS